MKASDLINLIDEQKACICPECGATVDTEMGKPCDEIECPECGATMRGEGCA